MFKKSPLAPAKIAELPPVTGVRIAGMAAGLKESGRPDLFMAELAPGTTVALAQGTWRCGTIGQARRWRAW